uniref:Uncharacterized protein n=1 Tax=Arundo donax TaxID=35708 RepID=A0A0A8Y7I0_ARUDO
MGGQKSNRGTIRQRKEL